MNKKRLISLMLASIITPGITMMAGCREKSKEEKANEEEIRQLLEFDAGIKIDNGSMGGGFGRIDLLAKDNKYLIIFTAKSANSKYQKITYSVDKDFYYYFKNNYSVVETDKDVGLISELTFDYDPIKVED